jgi:hypothetical protein
MKHDKHSQDQTQNPANVPQPDTMAKLDPRDAAFAPSPDEVARRAYFTYVNEGSLDGHEVQHWLTAEAELIAERNLTRVHGFHNQT